MLRLLLVLFLTCVPVAAAEWRGITPGTSTRADVVRELGECSATESFCEFNLPDEDVFIKFSGPESCSDVAEGTVLLIERYFARDQTFAGLNLDQRQFKKFDPTVPRKIGYQGYIDDKAGLLLKAHENKIFHAAYIPALTARKFCSPYYQKPREFIATYVEHAPRVWIACPKEPLKADKPLILKAQYNRGLSIVLSWRVAGATLLAGDGRSRITVDTTGLAGRSIEVFIESIDSRMFASTDTCKISFER